MTTVTLPNPKTGEIQCRKSLAERTLASMFSDEFDYSFGLTEGDAENGTWKCEKSFQKSIPGTDETETVVVATYELCTLNGGVTDCTCESYEFGCGKTCKHMPMLITRANLPIWVAGTLIHPDGDSFLAVTNLALRIEATEAEARRPAPAASGPIKFTTAASGAKVVDINSWLGGTK